jgi:hypothetical protein
MVVCGGSREQERAEGVRAVALSRGPPADDDFDAVAQGVFEPGWGATGSIGRIEPLPTTPSMSWVRANSSNVCGSTST